MGPQSAVTIAADVRSGRRRAVDICRAALDRISLLDSKIGAFLSRCDEYALRRATEIDSDIARGQSGGVLAGVPIAVKDNICTRFAATTAGSRIIENFQPPYDATVVQRLEAAGAIIVGKTNLDEFGMGSSTENSGFRPTRNPWNQGCVPGGSSGGSAAAVVARMTPVSLGSDTGGSVRQPAAMCGCVGLKPTYGRVSRYGLLAYGSSLDQIGPLAGCVEDAALTLGVIAGRDSHDATGAGHDVPDYLAALRDDALAERMRGLRIGVPREYFADGLDPQVRGAIDAALRECERLGARLVDVSLPRSNYCIATYYLIATAEASSNLARYDGVHYGRRTAKPRDIADVYSSSRNDGFGAEVKRRIMLGAFALSAGYYDAFYAKALRIRRLVQEDFRGAFEQADVLASPTAPTTAFRIGEKTADPLQMYLADIYTIAANLAGIPAISLPCGFSDAGLPIGLQFLGPLFGESVILQTARAYERETQWHTRRPAL